MFRKIKIKKIRTKIFVFIFLLSILPILIIGFFSYKLSLNINIQQTGQVYLYNLKTYNISLDILMDQLKNTTSGIISNKDILTGDNTISQILSEPVDENSKIYSYYIKLKNISNEINGTVTDKSNVVAATLYDNYGYKFNIELIGNNFFQQKYSPTSSTKLSNFKTLDWLMAIKRNSGKDLLFSSNIIDQTDQSTFTCGKEIIDLKTFESTGTLLLNIDKNALIRMFPVGGDLKKTTYLIVDSSNLQNIKTICKIGPISDTDDVLKKFYSNETSKLKKYIVKGTKNKTTGWDIICILDKPEVAKSANVLGMMLISFTILMFVVLLLLYFVLIHIINNPLAKLQKAILAVASGERLIIDEDFSDDEIGLIGNEFKQVVNQNLQLKDKLYKITIKEREAELKALQAQINPHFLYNVLDTIYWSAIMEGSETAAKMAISLSKMFKSSLSNGDSITTVNDELTVIENYLFILKLRYGEKIEYIQNIQPNIKDFKIVKLILQPIIENAINHGLEPKIGNGFLTISGEIEDDCLKFVIFDNGVGVESMDLFDSGFGLTNVRERIKLYYGDQWDLTFKSAKGQGTEVIVKIPIIKDDC